MSPNMVEEVRGFLAGLAGHGAAPARIPQVLRQIALGPARGHLDGDDLLQDLVADLLVRTRKHQTGGIPELLKLDDGQLVAALRRRVMQVSAAAGGDRWKTVKLVRERVRAVLRRPLPLVASPPTAVTRGGRVDTGGVPSALSDAPPQKTDLALLNQNETVTRLYQLINEAERHIFLVSPYVTFDKLRTLVRHLQGALTRKVKVKLVIREKDASTGGSDVLGGEAVRALRDAGMEVRVLKDLHAKIYLSEKNALLTSLNLLDSSFNNSIEIGAWLTAGTAEYRMVVEFLRDEIQPTSVLVKALPAPAVLAPPKPATAESVLGPARKAAGNSRTALPFDDGSALFEDDLDSCGHCIRCGGSLEFNPEKPLCPDCYAVWKRYGDPDYAEAFCHSCGDKAETSMAKPLCYPCYQEQR